MPEMTYELCVARVPERTERLPKYKVFVYRYIHAGICGPFTEQVEVTGMAEVVKQAEAWGFQITGLPELSLDLGRPSATFPLEYATV